MFKKDIVNQIGYYDEDLEQISRYSQSWYDYFNVAQFRIDNIKENNLESIVEKRVKALKKTWYKKFSYSVKKMRMLI